MKKILLMALIAVFAVACSSKGTQIGGPYLRYAKSDFAGKITCEVRDSITKEKVITAKEGFTNVVYYHGVFLAAKDGVWSVFDFRDKKLVPLFDGKTFKTYVPKNGNLELISDKGKLLYLTKINKTVGPAASFEIVKDYGLIFVTDGKRWGAYNLQNASEAIPVKYENLVYAIADNGETAFYSGSQRILPTGTLGKALTKYAYQAFKKEADANKTPWPENGFGCVKVKKLR